MPFDEVARTACLNGINDSNVEGCLERLDSFYRTCKKRVDYLGDKTIVESFKARVFPILINTGEFSQVLRDQNHWLNDFEDGTTDFRLSIKEFDSENRASMPDILSCYVRLRYCEAVNNLWTSLSESEISKSPSSLGPQLSGLAQSKWALQTEPKPGETKLSHLGYFASIADTDNGSRLWKARDRWSQYDTTNGLRIMISSFGASYSRIKDNDSWSPLMSQLQKFVRLTRCSGSFDDIFMCLSSFRMKVSETSLENREAELKAEITVLKRAMKAKEEELAEQAKILFCLKFRHILERLPPREGKNEKNAWDDFWKDAINQANEGRTSPLSDIVRRYGRTEKKKNKKKGDDKERDEGVGAGTIHTVDYIRIHGGAQLYSILSTDIHSYAVSKDDAAPAGFHNLEREIFDALKPRGDNILPDGSVNWDLERARFVGSNKPTSTRTRESAETKSSTKAEESDDSGL